MEKIEVRITGDSSSLERAAQQSKRSISQLEESMRGTERATESLTASFSRMGHTAVAALGGREILQTADAWQNLNAQLRIATGSMQSGIQAYASVRQIAMETGQSLEQIGGVYRRFSENAAALGVSQQEVANVSRTVAKAIALSGGSAESSAAALTQFNQALASGALRGEELNSVLEQAPRLARVIADGMNIPVGKLRELAEQGKITSDVLLNALGGQSQKVADEFSKLPLTMGRAMENLRSSWVDTVGSFEQGTGAFAGLAKGVDLVAKNMDVLAAAGGAVAVLLSGKLVSALVTAAQAKAADVVATLRQVQAQAAAAAASREYVALKLAEAQASAAAATGMQRLAIVQASVIPLQRELATATAASAAAQTASVGAAGLARGALAALGGPIGLGITLLTAAGTAWMLWRDKTEQATAQAAASASEHLDSIIDRMRELNSRLADTRRTAYEGTVGQAESELKTVKAQIGYLQGELDKLDQKGGKGRFTDAGKRMQEELNGLSSREITLEGQLGEARRRSAEVGTGALQKFIDTHAVGAEKARVQIKKLQDDFDSAMQQAGGYNADNPAHVAAKKALDAAKQDALKSVKQEIDPVTKAFKDAKADLEKSVLQSEGKFIGAGDKVKASLVDSGDWKKLSPAMQGVIDKMVVQANAAEASANATKKYREEVKSLQEQIKAQRDSNEEIGLTASEIEKLKSQRLEDAAAIAEQTYSKREMEGADKAELAAIAEKAKALRELSALRRDGSARQAAADEAKRAAQEWKKFGDDIERALTDSLMRGFESGKGFGQSFVDSLKNTLKTAALKMTVQAIVDPVMGTVRGMMGGGGVPGQPAGGMSLVSTGSSLYNGYQLLSGSNMAYQAGSMATSFAGSSMGTAMGLSETVAGAAPGAVAITETGSAMISAASTIGQAVPYIAAAYAALSLLGAFDSGPKEKRQIVHGLGPASSYEDGKAYVDSVFGRYGYSDAGTIYADGRGMANTLAASKTADNSIVQLLGLSGSQIEGVKGRLAKQDLSYMGENMSDQDAIKRLIASHLTAAFEEARPALASVVSEMGPDKVEQMLAFATAVRGTETLFSNLGMSAGNLNADLVKALGGAEEFTASMGKLSTLLAASPLEQAITAAKSGRSSIAATLDGAGVDRSALAATTADMKQYAAALDLTTEAGRQGLKTLADIGPQIKGYQDQLLALAGTTRDALTKSYLDALKAAPDAATAGQAVADVIVTGLQDSMLTSYAGQITDIMVSGIITPAIDGLLQGQAISEALSQASIDAAVKKAEATATAFTALWNDPSFQAAMATIKKSVAGVGAAGYVPNLPRPQPAVVSATDSAAQAAVEAAKTAQNLLDGIKSRSVDTQRQIEKLGLSTYQQSIYDLNASYADQAKEIAKLTTGQEAATTALDSWYQAQLRLVAAQSAVENFGQAVTSLQSILESATSASKLRIAGEDDYMRIAGFSASKQASIIEQRGMASLADLEKRWNSLSVTDQLAGVDTLRGYIVQRYDLERQAIQEIQEAAQKAADSWQNVGASVRDSAKALLTGDLSPLNLRQRTDTAQSDYRQILGAALGGDSTAAGKLAGAAETYLKNAQQSAGSASEYAATFARVQSEMTALGSYADDQYAQAKKSADSADALVKIQTKALDDLQSLARVLGGVDQTIASQTISASEQVAFWAGVTKSLGAEGAIVGAIGKLPADLAARINGQQITPAASAPTGTAGNAATSAVAAALANNTNAAAAYQGAMAAGATVAQIAAAWNAQTGQQVTATDVEKWAKAAGIPGYATGGTFAGGLRLVGERGPELEATGPARIWSAADTRRLLSGGDNTALVAEVRALRAELSALRADNTAENRAAVGFLAKTARVLDAVTAGGETLKTEAVL